MTIQVSAMSYEQAREQALFLTDKMAYELNLTDDQYEAAYEINLDYLMGIDDHSDLYGAYWTQRNLDLSYILLDWQYRAYVDAAYFYRPLYWDAGYWHFGVYARYPHRDYFYFGRPHFYVTYRGGHSWRVNGGRSWYHGRHFGGVREGGMARIGMRDGFHRGDFGRGTRVSTHDNDNRSFGNGTRTFGNGSRNIPDYHNGTRTFGGGTRSAMPNGNMPNRTRSFGSSRQSSTRFTATRPSTIRSFGDGTQPTTPRSTFTPNPQGTRSFGGSSSGRVMNAPSRSGSMGGSHGSAPRTFGGGNSGSRPSGGSTGGHFGRGR